MLNMDMVDLSEVKSYFRFLYDDKCNRESYHSSIAVVCKDGKIVAHGSNKVVPTNDPTAHAEIVTIRLACQELKTHNLEGCVIYCSCEPCPMCLGAIYWSHLDHIYFSHSKHDAKEGNIHFFYIVEPR